MGAKQSMQGTPTLAPPTPVKALLALLLQPLELCVPLWYQQRQLAAAVVPQLHPQHLFVSLHPRQGQGRKHALASRKGSEPGLHASSSTWRRGQAAQPTRPLAPQSP